MNKALQIAIVLAALAALLGYVFLTSHRAAAPVTPSAVTTSTTVVADKLYVNNNAGMRFTYPEGYDITEGKQGDDKKPFYSVVLVSHEDNLSPEAVEGPPSVNVDIYPNASQKLSLKEWIENAAESNYTLGDKKVATTTVAGQSALRFGWEGLYSGETTAFIGGTNIIAVSVTYTDRMNDPQIKAYNEVLRTLQLQASN